MAGRWFRLAAAFVVPFAISLAVSLARYEASHPRINVRWNESVLPSQRKTLEAAFQLVEPEFREGRTWSYALLDASTDNLRRLVQDPSVEDTHGIDRPAFKLDKPLPTPLSVFFGLLGTPSLIGVAGASLFALIWLAPSWPFHVLLIAAYPVIQLYGQNVGEVPLGDVAPPFFVMVGVGVIVWALAWTVCRTPTKSAIVSSITVLPLMFFEPIHEFVTSLNPVLGRPDVLVALGLALHLGLLSRFRRVDSVAIDTVSKALNTFAITIVSVALFPIVSFHVSDYRAGNDPPVEIPPRFAIGSWSCQTGYCPDIYYLVLDGYGRDDALEAAYGIQNQPFLSALRADGFWLAGHSTANYPNTFPALASALNMDYEHAPRDGTSSFRIDVSLVALLLRKLGYNYILVPSGLPLTSSSPLADVTLDAGATQSEFAAHLLERSALGAVIQSDRQKNPPVLDDLEKNEQAVGVGVAAGLDGALQWHRHIKDSFHAIGDMPVGRRPRFVFAHIVSPHPPYVFDRNGDLPPDSRMTDLSDLEAKNIWDSPKFPGQLDYLNRLVLELVRRIQATATRPPIIIIHGDHGSNRFGDAGPDANLSERVLAERMSILFAVLAPPKITELFYDRITPVNTFRVLLRGLFGAPLSPLDDKNYWTSAGPPRDVSEAVQGHAFGGG